MNSHIKCTIHGYQHHTTLTRECKFAHDSHTLCKTKEGRRNKIITRQAQVNKIIYLEKPLLIDGVYMCFPIALVHPCYTII